MKRTTKESEKKYSEKTFSIKYIALFVCICMAAKGILNVIRVKAKRPEKKTKLFYPFLHVCLVSTSICWRMRIIMVINMSNRNKDKNENETHSSVRAICTSINTDKTFRNTIDWNSNENQVENANVVYDSPINLKYGWYFGGESHTIILY